MPHPVLYKVHCIAIEGADARRFAQAQFSGDLGTLAEERWQWNAWLDAQGHVQALMHLADLGGDRLLAILRGGDAAATCARLGRYRFRAKASLSARVFGGHAADALPLGHIDVDAQDRIAFGYGDRSLRLVTTGASADGKAANAWRLADIRAGWPALPVGDAQFLPPALALERLGAVSLDKGCYPGQEIVARLHYRGRHKLALHHVRGPVPLEPGASLHCDEAGLIHVLDCAFTPDGAIEALVVAHVSDINTFNILDVKYDVVSRYDA